jgi:uncharacterized protein (TIGR02284 family)
MKGTFQMASDSKDVSVLNTLIATLLDSVEGYQKSAGEVKNPLLADKFKARGQERQAAVAELQAAVISVGGQPEDDSTVLGGMHRAFLNLKEAVLGTDDKAIINEVERGEDYLKKKFETALGEADLSPAAKSAVNQAWQSVRAGHDEMSALKHSLGG